jgi:hypothetical protein
MSGHGGRCLLSDTHTGDGSAATTDGSEQQKRTALRIEQHCIDACGCDAQDMLHAHLHTAAAARHIRHGTGFWHCERTSTCHIALRGFRVSSSRYVHGYGPSHTSDT